MEKPPLHLKHPDLQSSEEVDRAVERKERKTRESVPNDPSDRLDAYTERLERIFLNPDERVRERNLDLFRDQIYDALIVKKENFPDSYFELQKRVARERGQPVDEISPEIKERMMETAIEDQRASLDAWITYLTSEDAVYPAWFKYFVWRNITKLSQFNKERGESSRNAPLPPLLHTPTSTESPWHR